MKALFEQLEAINARAQEIVGVAQKTGDWETAYDLIFSNVIINAARVLIKDLNLSFEYYDPDTSYRDDVMAYTNALDRFITEKKPFFA
jgi:hypothetical protein